jgi:hypothetical protein
MVTLVGTSGWAAGLRGTGWERQEACRRVRAVVKVPNQLRPCCRQLLMPEVDTPRLPSPSCAAHVETRYGSVAAVTTRARIWTPAAAASQTFPADRVGAAVSRVPVMPVACCQDLRICRNWRLKSGSPAVWDTGAPSRRVRLGRPVRAHGIDVVKPEDGVEMDRHAANCYLTPRRHVDHVLRRW